jgi:branched-chain amino acid transport system ATP-binding protein
VTPILKIDGLRKAFGSLRVSDGISLEVNPGELHAVIGPNGAGKSVLLAQISGLLSPDAGSIEFGGALVTDQATHRRAQRGMALTFQIPSFFPTMTARENVAVAVQARTNSDLGFFRNADRDPQIGAAVSDLLRRTQLDHRAGVVSSVLAHGEHRQLELAMALAGQPTLLLLDEPMAGLGADDSRIIVRLLHDIKRTHTILMVEHDMDAVFELADRISVLVYGRVIATGTPTDIRNNDAVREAYLGGDE